MASITKYSCKYCAIDGLNRKEFIKHTKSKDHKILMFNYISGDKIEQRLNYSRMKGRAGVTKGNKKAVVKEIMTRLESVIDITE